MIPAAWLDEARQCKAPHLQRTPLTFDPRLEIYLKWENHQVTGSFKARGALYKALTLDPEERDRGLVTASAGNHGQGLALAAHLVGAEATVFVSEHAVPAKIDAMRILGADVRLVPGGYSEAERAGMAYAIEHGSTWVSPYNDSRVIAGQGSLALEAFEQLQLQPNPGRLPAAWVVPAGGGGLVSGIGLALRDEARRPRLIAVQSEASPYLYELYQHGSQDGVVELPSLADGLAGGVEPGSQTIGLVSETVDDFILVSEEDTARAVAYAWFKYGEKIEGSAAVALAAILGGKITLRPALVLITGGNIQAALHADLCRRFREDVIVEISRETIV